MKKPLVLVSLRLALAAAAQTNVLELQWLQPPGYQSTLYSATNLDGGWTSLGVVNPPYFTTPTNQVAFFYVAVAPMNVAGDYAGGTDPTNVNALMGSSYIKTNTQDFWMNVYGGTNGWLEYISGP